MFLVVFLVLCVFALAGATVVTIRNSLSSDPQAAPTAAPSSETAGRDTVRTPAPKDKKPRKREKPKKPPKPIGTPTDLSDFARQVAELRDLELERDLNARLVGSGALADKISDIAFSEQDPEEIEETEQLLVALRMAEPDVGLAEIVEDLYREQIIGLYVPEEATLYVRRRGGGSPAERITTAHEITHALQDQAFDLVKLQAEHEDNDDASLAVLALIEGDAVLTQQLWAQRYLTSDELGQVAEESTGGEALDRAPDYLRNSLFFPYQDGGLFVAELYRKGGFSAVNEAFRDPPTSTEQIMYPDRYLEGDDPVPVKIEGHPGSGWKKAARYDFGAFDLDEMLQPLGAATASDAAEGWGGGAIRSWTRGDMTAVAAMLRFDTAEDAAEACDALPRWYAEVASAQPTGSGTYTGDRDHFAVRCFEDEVHFGLAPTAETTRKLTAAP